MGAIPVKQLVRSLECGPGGCVGAGNTPMIISPDTDDEALALESIAVALENLCLGLEDNSAVATFIRPLLTNSSQVSNEAMDSGTVAGVVAAIIASIVAAVAWFMKRMSTKSEKSLNEDVQRIRELSEDVKGHGTVADVDTAELKQFKSEFWSRYVKGAFAAGLMFYNEFSEFTKVMNSWGLHTNNEIATKVDRWEAVIRRGVKEGGNEIPSDAKLDFDIEGIFKAASTLASAMNIKNHFSQETEIGKLQFINAVMTAVNQYRPPYNDRAMAKLLQRDIVSSTDIDIKSQSVRMITQARTAMDRYSKRLEKMLKQSESDKARTSALFKEEISRVSAAIRAILNYLNWQVQGLELDKAMLRTYSTFLKSQK